MQNPESSSANSCPIFTLKHLTFPGFKTQQETQQDSTQVEAKNQCQFNPIQAPEQQGRRLLW